MAKDNRERRITIRLSDEEWRMLRMMSYEMEISPSEVVRRTIENYYKYYQYCP